MCTTKYEYLFAIYVNSIYLVCFKYIEDPGEGLALTRHLTVLTQWVPGLRLRHCQICNHIILRLGAKTPIRIKISYQVMAWRPFGARPLSDIICITKFSDKTCLVTEILSVTSSAGLKLLIQLLYIITNTIKKIWALVRLSFTQMKQYEHSAFWWRTYDFYVNGFWIYLIITSVQYTD